MSEFSIGDVVIIKTARDCLPMHGDHLNAGDIAVIHPASKAISVPGFVCVESRENAIGDDLFPFWDNDLIHSGYKL